VTCPECGRTDVRFVQTRRLWECKGSHIRKQFTAMETALSNLKAMQAQMAAQLPQTTTTG